MKLGRTLVRRGDDTPDGLVAHEGPLRDVDGTTAESGFGLGEVVDPHPLERFVEAEVARRCRRPR